MHLHLIIAALLPLSSTALVPRSATTIVNSINNINANILTVNKTLNTLTSNPLTGIGTVLKIQSQTSTLLKAVNSATTVAQQSNKLTENGSNTVVNAVSDLVPNIQSLVANLVRHKPIFDTVFLGVGSASPQVKKDLQAQQKAALALSSAIKSKLTPDTASLAPIIIGILNKTFNDAIKTFSNSGPGLPVPPIFPPKE